MPTRTLSEVVAHLGSVLEPEALERLTGALQSSFLTASTTTPGALVAAAGGSRFLSPLMASELSTTWRSLGPAAMPAPALALAIEAAAGAANRLRAEAPKLDLVWTGETDLLPHNLLLTRPVIAEMLASAERRVLVMGYDLRQAANWVIEALIAARQRGCVIVVALHDNGHNHAHLRDRWVEMTDDPMVRLLRWRGRPDDSMASLHAKLLAVDDADALLTSANLTYHGLERNLEMGVRIRGAAAKGIIHHIARLEEHGILVPFEPSTEE